MPYHHGLERKKFDACQRALRRKYRQAGMPEPDIQALHQLDLREFLGERRHREHTLPLSEASASVGGRSEGCSRYMWVEEIGAPILAKRLKSLPEADLEIITLYVIDGYRQTEIAALLGVTKQAVSKRIRALKTSPKIFGCQKRFPTGYRVEAQIYVSTHLDNRILHSADTLPLLPGHMGNPASYRSGHAMT